MIPQMIRITLNINLIIFSTNSSFINPNLLAMTLYTLRGEWMWQFDNKNHYFDRYCNTCSFVERSIRPTTLLWCVSKLEDTPI